MFVLLLTNIKNDMIRILLTILFFTNAIYANTTISAPTNDNCGNAISITVNTNTTCALTTSGTIAEATDSGISSNGEGTPNDDVWFTFVATRPTHLISMENVMGTYDDLVHEVFDGTCSALTSLLVSDPDSSVVTGLTIGNTYFLRVYGFSFSAERDTTFAICIKEAPINNDFVEAQELSVELGCTNTLGTLTGATPSGAPFSSCGSNDDTDVDVWYSFVAPTNGSIEIKTSIGFATDIDTVITLYSYNGSTLTEVTCDDDGLSPYSLISITDGSLISGNIYYIKVHELYGDNSISFNICLTTAVTASVDDLQSIGLTYYPNPVSNILTLKADKQINSVRIFNMLGQEVRNNTSSALKVNIDMYDLETGTYFIKVLVDNTLRTFKVFRT